ncbi:MAG: PD-(D/E)XK nuclease family protein [Alistipes sp.]|nr:PD-(D/E)XK nuclease family protein [Alistipes sp.]
MQQTFLSEVAEKLYNNHGDNISSLTLVFPSRRARLFFSDALAKIIDKPIWQPQYISMDDIMCEASSFVVGNKIQLITELFNIYKQHHPSEEFDKFYFWGEMLLNDFDLIDKYLIDADMLFSNIYDIKELEADLSYLTPEMRQIISSFWSNFSNKDSLSDEKRKFMTIWQSLAPIYHSFYKRLQQLQVAYTGMIYRVAVENIENNIAHPDISKHYVFIGFNALSECEKRVLKYLDNNCICDFVWDYDVYYTQQKEQEAGHFLRNNLSQFKPSIEISNNNFSNEKKSLRAISTVSNAIQCKYVNKILHEISPSLQFDSRTAIVLTDESLLLPLLHSLPEELQDNINVTMGYPLRQTTAYSFIERLIELQKNCRTETNGYNFYHIDVNGILSHPFITNIIGDTARQKQKEIIDGRHIRVSDTFFAQDELLNTIFSPHDKYSSLSKYLLDVINAIFLTKSDCGNDDLMLSYLSIIADNINELDNCLKICNINISNSIYTSLLRRHLQTTRIPFSGEPLQGLQIMGILETRNLDFDNVIILSMNDDNFPGNLTGTSSFIPYNLRAAYGIPTPEHHEGVYAYYFYRLIQRAKRVDMLYCSHADEKSTGEQSRYIYQLDFESPYDIEHINAGVDITVSDTTDDVVPKSGQTAKELERFTRAENKKLLSPSAFANYITCPMKFYFSSIAKLKSPDELSEEVDSPMFGTILHDAMEILYAQIEGIANPISQLEKISEKDVEHAVVESINKNYLNNHNTQTTAYTGSLMLVKRIIVKYIYHGIIPYDIKHNNFALMAVEEDINSQFTLDDGRQIAIGGRADRIDSLDNGTIRVVDYKTGECNLDFNGIESLFTGATRNKKKNLLQTMIYSMVLNNKFQRNVQPALYYARHIHEKEYSPLLIDKSNKECAGVYYNDYASSFEPMLREKLNELFDLSRPFERCSAEESRENCTYCDFKAICKR